MRGSASKEKRPASRSKEAARQGSSGSGEREPEPAAVDDHRRADLAHWKRKRSRHLQGLGVGEPEMALDAVLVAEDEGAAVGEQAQGSPASSPSAERG